MTPYSIACLQLYLVQLTLANSLAWKMSFSQRKLFQGLEKALVNVFSSLPSHQVWDWSSPRKMRGVSSTLLILQPCEAKVLQSIVSFYLWSAKQNRGQTEVRVITWIILLILSSKIPEFGIVSGESLALQGPAYKQMSSTYTEAFQLFLGSAVTNKELPLLSFGIRMYRNHLTMQFSLITSHGYTKTSIRLRTWLHHYALNKLVLDIYVCGFSTKDHPGKLR